MTSDEIKKIKAMDLSSNAWLREIAYQLALLNEKQGAKKWEQRSSTTQ